MVRLPWRRKREQHPAREQTHIDTETWAEKDAKVEVTQPKGFFTRVEGSFTWTVVRLSARGTSQDSRYTAEDSDACNVVV